MSLILIISFLICLLILLLCFMCFNEETNIDQLISDYEKELQTNNRIIIANKKQINLLKRKIVKLKNTIYNKNNL